MLGLSTDNDGAFINETLIEYCAKNRITFTRGRPRRSNDQAWIEQKNGAVIRKLTGHDRYQVKWPGLSTQEPVFFKVDSSPVFLASSAALEQRA